MAMRFLVVGLVLATTALAQLSQSTVNFVGRGQWAPPDAFTAVTVTGGAPSIGAWSGDLAGAVATQISGQTINVFLNGNGTYNLSYSPSGTLHTATATVTASGACAGGCTLTANLTNYTRAQASFFYLGGASCSGCTNPGPATVPWQDPAFNAMPTPMNPGNATLVPIIACPGGTWTDPVLGGTVTCITPNGFNQAMAADSTNSGINADHSIVALVQLDGVNVGSIYLTKTDGSGTQCKTPAPSNIGPMWDPHSLSSPYKFYIFSGLSLQSYTFAFAGCTFTGPTTIYTYPGSGTNITCSGDCIVPLNGKLAFNVTGGDTVVGVVDVNTGVALTRNYTGDPAFGSPRTIVYSSPNVSEATGKQYIHFDAFAPGSNEILDLTNSGTTLTVEGPEALISENIYNNGGTPFLAYQPSTTTDCSSLTYHCQSTQHAAVFETRIGGKLHEMYFEGVGTIAVPQGVPTAIDLDAGVANGMRISEDSGTGASGGAKAGGLYGNFPADTQASGTHFSCAHGASVCEQSQEGAVASSWEITNVATGNPPTITTCIPASCPTASTTGLANGNVVIIGGVGGVTGMPSTGVLCTIANITATTIQCSGLSTSGTYTTSTGTLILNTAATGPHLNEILVMDFTTITAPRVVRPWHHNSTRETDHLGGGSDYFTQSHAGMSPDGQLVCASTNWGIPENYRVICGPTGYPFPVSINAVSMAAVAVR